MILLEKIIAGTRERGNLMLGVSDLNVKEGVREPRILSVP